jgi:UDP-N-acetylglucosamine 2-epimerase (non-hydrolysing)/GDP/UDP-N,N'-diacetylbacillosamine 2-epimerase (hydrolysing)
MRTLAVVTTSRADYGIYLPVLRAIHAAPDLQLTLLVTGMHLSPEFGLTVQKIEADGFPIGERIEMLLSSDTPQGIARSMGMGVAGFAQSYARSQPDLLLVLGDRFEMHAAVLAALPFTIPVAHIHGGEVTRGAIDDALRHSITKLSHLHFVSTQEYAQRVIQLGEEPWRVHVSGAPSLDNLHTIQLLDHAAFAEQYGITLAQDFLLVTYHPVTLEHQQTTWQIEQVLAALERSQYPILFTMTNADTAGRIINQRIQAYVATHSNAHWVDNLGTQGYFSAMTLARAMVGNSSSGIIEAASFTLPVVNIGNRQRGRVRGPQVVDVEPTSDAISAGIAQACAPAFRESLQGCSNPYGDGKAAERIIAVLREVSLDARLIQKQFYDVTASAGTGDTTRFG